MLQVVLQWVLACFQEDCGHLVAGSGVLVSNTRQVDSVLIAIDKDSLAVHLEPGVNGADGEGGSHQDDNDDEDDGEHDRSENGKPLLQRAARLFAASETLLFLALAVGDNTVGSNAPDRHDEGPDHACDANPALLKPEARDSQDEDHVDRQEQGDDGRGDAQALGRHDKEDGDHEKVTQGQTGVGKVEEARAAAVHAWGRHEDGDQQEDPPQESDDEEEDGQVAHSTHRPQVVRRDLSHVST